MTLRRMITDDEADWQILSRANDKGKFAVPLGTPIPKQWPDEVQAAFERGIDAEWWTLVDLDRISSMPGALCKVFRLTAAGRARRDELATLFGNPAGESSDEEERDERN